MPNDTSLKSVFDYAKGPPLSGGDFKTRPAVFATYVEHLPHAHPPGGTEYADLVRYANGILRLSSDKKTLSGVLRIWSNIHDEGVPAFFDIPAVPPDAFDDPNTKAAVEITLSDVGTLTRRFKVNDVWSTPATMNAVYENGLIIDKSPAGLKTLSFTLGKTVG